MSNKQVWGIGVIVYAVAVYFVLITQSQLILKIIFWLIFSAGFIAFVLGGDKSDQSTH